MTSPKDIKKRIGIDFKHEALLKLAITHSSYVNEYPAIAPESNERLEFLGDAILGMIIAEHLYLKFPEQAEGELTGFRASLVCTTTLAEIAKTIDLGNYLLLGKGEESSGGRNKDANLAGALEALVAAVYLDKGLEPTRGFILKLFETVMEKPGEQGSCVDFKSRLQQIFQARKGEAKETPVYYIVEETGPDHKRVFTAEVKVRETLLGRGSGKSKKIAETEAAKAALEKLK